MVDMPIIITSNMSQAHIHEPQLDDDVIQLKPILESEAEHGPIFRRELFNAAYAVWNSIDRDNSQNIDFTILNIYGRPCQSSLCLGGGETDSSGRCLIWKFIWSYNHLQSLGMRYDPLTKFPLDEPLCPYAFSAQAMSLAYEQNCFDINDLMERKDAWGLQWERSDMCRQLTAFLEEHAVKTMRKVDQVVCFGLGCLQGKSTYTQHLAARHVAELFARVQSGPAPRIVAQDPIYCSAGISYLTAPTSFNMEILTDPEGFRVLTGQTFILSFAPNVPVRQVAMGLTHDTSGPAGMFCDSILSDGLGCDGKGFQVINGHRWTPYNTCEPSPALWEYKQKGAWIELSDQPGERMFGNVGVYLKNR